MLAQLDLPNVAKFTRLGPLIAPHVPHLHPDASFPLKICHAGGSHTYLDLSRKWLCNWLSLIPPGSSSYKNLLACQVEDLIYYIAAEEIEAGSELRVWYAPFYQQKVKEELKALGYGQSLGGAAVLTRRVPLRPPQSKVPLGGQLHISTPSLSRIEVGRGQVTFTHNAKGSEPDSLFLEQPAVTESPLVGNKYLPGEAGLGRQIQTPVTSAGYLRDDYIQHKKRVDSLGQDDFGYSAQTNHTSTSQSIVLVSNRNASREPECIVTFTITAASENYDPNSSSGEHYDNGNLQPEECLMGDSSHEDSSPDVDRKDIQFHPVTQKRKSYKIREPKTEVCVADSDVVKQLPPRALGAREPRPWSCKYCGNNFTSLLPFANHLKAHLLWLVGRCHVCQECGSSFSSSLQLHRHQQATHQQGGFQAASQAVSVCRGEGEVLVKHELFSDDEAAVDDPGGKESKEDVRKIPALPTNHVEGPHSCQICSKHFAKAEYLLRHLRKHTGDFTCQYCLKVFARKEGLQKHTCPKGGHQERLKCSLCSRCFLNPNLLEQHYLRHKGNKKCIRCNRTFSNLASLERHMKICPSVEISSFFKCSICGKDMVSERMLERHMASHSRQYQCELCGKPYSNSTNLAQHVPLCRQSRQVASIGHVACEDCGEEFTDASAFRAHYHTHTHPFHCSCCNHRFRTRVGYEVHVCEIEQHCDQCSSVFRSVQALNRHYAVHGPPPHTCVSCRRSFFRKESLDRHVCSFEADIKDVPKQKETSRFTCNVCGAALATKHSLNTHMRSAHGGSAARELHCEICGKQFHRKDLLGEHQAVHAPPSFPCPTCKKLFKTRKSLEVHSLLHLGIKRFACKYCNKKFHQKVNLSRHERSHMPRGAVKCQYCGTHCLSTNDLKAHLLSHTVFQSEVKQQDNQADFDTGKEATHDEGLSTYQNAAETSDGLDQKLDPEFRPHNGVGPQLKITRRTKDGLQTEERTFSGPNSVIEVEQSLGSTSKRVKLTMKGKTGIKNNGQKVSSGFRTGLVHGVAPAIVSDINMQPSVSNSGIHNHSTVFIPPRIPNSCLSSNEQSLNSSYLVPGEPETIPSNSSGLCNSGVFPETSNSLNSGVCNLPSNVMLETAPIASVSDATHSYNLNSDENCHVSMGRNQSDLEQMNNSQNKDLTLGSCPAMVEQVCLYESNSNNVSVTTATTQALDCHVLSNEQIVESVVLMTDPPHTSC
ncbi:Zinc finger protein 26-like 10 [Homarus americanus]|uniref:Zinc finger protein 26-like 10 n=1 Tax=Homarus americanus TaxID=6706 RepID=A0A8J5N8T5_HOMAM|nr:Zinc finger protein 26-like 10 [Homarus americanus]